MTQEKKYYVYVHRYASGPKRGEVFYIGKGTGDRKYLKNSRSIYWKRVVSKYGRTVDVLKDGMSESCALSFEKIVIKILRDSGCDLVNMTDGGEGMSGMAHPSRIRVFSSLGEEFCSMMDAANFLKNNGYPKASVAAIQKCINGLKKTCYGRAWDTESIPDHPNKVGPSARALWPIENQGKKIITECGLEFNSKHSAVAWLRENGWPNAIRQPITLCCRGQRSIAYGYVWMEL